MDKPILFRGRVRVSVPRDVDVRALRKRLGMSQNLFAARFGFPLATLRHWEYGRRKPSGACLTLLNVIAANPRAVLQALRRPPDARPIEDDVALWQAAETRKQEIRTAAAEDEAEEREAEALGKRLQAMKARARSGTRKAVSGKSDPLDQ